MDRRRFLKYNFAASALLPLTRSHTINVKTDAQRIDEKVSSRQICIFIKLLERFNYLDIATILSESGFKAADISLRDGGIIAPEVAKIELPKLVKIFSQKKISIPMAVTGITDPDNQNIETILKVMKDNDIRYYRLGSIKYNKQISICENLSILKKKMIKLQELNSKYELHGAIQNHTGMRFGSAVWDAYEVVKECDPKYVGIQYDVRHAMADGIGSWPIGLEIALSHIDTTCIKDFTWKEKNGTFSPITVPLGEGIVDFRKYFEILNTKKISGPVSIHYEYPPLSSINLTNNSTEQMKKIIPLLKRDLNIYKKMMGQI